MRPEVILDALRKSGATVEGEGTAPKQPSITKQDLMELGLSGGKDASFLRQRLLKKLDLPEHMSANAMLQALNILYDFEQLKDLIDQL